MQLMSWIKFHNITQKGITIPVITNDFYVTSFQFNYSCFELT